LEYDIIIIGATSFVGQRFIKYYSEYFRDKNIRVLATARNKKKLEGVLSGIKNIDSALLDVHNEKIVFDTIQKGYLVLNFAGPFDLYGENVVAACAFHGVHYLDITGEVHFTKRMIEKYDEEAKKSKTQIVSFAGFDSIPSDYTVFMASLESEKMGEKIKSIDIIYNFRGGFNGGTIQTAMDMANKISDYDLSNRKYLVGGDDFVQNDSTKKRYIKELNIWVSPFFMEPINSKIVYRSIFLWNKERFLDDFSYRESVQIPGGKLGNSILSMGLSAGNKLFKKKIGRKLISLVLPKPGQGPSDESINQGYLKSKIIVRLESGSVLRSSMYSAGDPGNKTTIKLLGSAMKAFLEKKTLERNGFLTPSGCFGENLFSFLEEEGISFKEFEKISI